MPTYEYHCTKCDHHFEHVQSIADKPLTTCPKEECAMKKWGKGKVKKKISAGGGLIFKGSGFYITDYRSENYKASAKKEAGKASPAGSESKPPASGASDTKATPPKPAKSDAKKPEKS